MSTTTGVRAAVTYGLHADAYAVAHALDVALQGHGYHVSVQEVRDGDDVRHEVWFCRRGEPVTEAVAFKPGEQLVVEGSGAWRIDPAPVVTS